MPHYIDLDRQFVKLVDPPSEQQYLAHTLGKSESWSEILAHQFVVIEGRANFGKSTELRRQAEQIRSEKGHAIFVALRNVLNAQSLPEAVDPVDASSYRTWTLTPNDRLSVFVDSLDEASLGISGGIRPSLARLIHWLEGVAGNNIHWVLSTRPAILNADTISVLSGLLSDFAARLEVQPNQTTYSKSELASSSPAPREPSNGVQRYRMRELTPAQSRRYLSEKHAVARPLDVLKTARRHGLSGFVDSPGALDVLALVDFVGSPPTSLTDAFDRVVGTLIQLHTGERIPNTVEATGSKLREATQKLACATILCQLPQMHLPSDRLDRSPEALSAVRIVGADLPAPLLRYLLGSELFIDSGGHDKVKIFPDELQPYLAAKHLSNLVGSPEEASKLVEHLSWKAPTGECGVYQHLMPLAGWMATINPHCRELLLPLDPQAVAFFGDLRFQGFQHHAAEQALRETLHRLSNRSEQLGREYFTLTPENYWQAASPNLERVLVDLYLVHDPRNESWARDALLDIATYGRSTCLRDAVLKSNAGDYARILNTHSDLHYLIELELDEDLAQLANALRRASRPAEHSVSLLLPVLAWRYLNAETVAHLIAQQFAFRASNPSLSYVVTTQIVGLATTAERLALLRQMLTQLARVGRGALVLRSTDSTESFVELISDSLGETISLEADPSEVATLIYVFLRLNKRYRWVHDSFRSLTRPLRKAHSVRRLVQARIVRGARHSDSDLRVSLVGYMNSCPFFASDIPVHNSAQLDHWWQSMLAANERANKEASPSVEARVTSRRRPLVDDESKQKLLQEVPQIRDGSGIGAIAFLASRLSRTGSTGKYGAADLEAIRMELDEPLFSAFREGLSRIWRDRGPDLDQQAPNTIFHTTVAGLMGLHFDLSDASSRKSLSRDEVSRAIQYATFEINGLPEWFWPLIEQHELVATPLLVASVTSHTLGALSRQHSEALLAASVSAPPSIRTALAPVAWQLLTESFALDTLAVEDLLRAALATQHRPPRHEFESTAWSVISSLHEPSYSTPVGLRSNVQEAWGAYWLFHYPDSFRSRIGEWLTGRSPAAIDYIARLAAYLGQRNSEQLHTLAKDLVVGLEALHDLFMWVHSVIRPEEDVEHPSGIVYDVKARDHAERLRDGLLTIIASSNTQRAYDTLGRVRRAMQDPSWAAYIGRLQRALQERRHSRPPIAQEEFSSFESSLHVRPTQFQSFAMAIHADLLEVKYQIERGNFSLRRFLSEVRLQPKEDREAGLALESHFQQLLASELNHAARGRYSIVLESQLPEATRQDLHLLTNGLNASVELKMSERWTIREYEEALEKQLVGQYMRHRNSQAGFFVIVLQKPRTWTLSSGKRIGFSGLIQRLTEHAVRLESNVVGRFLRIVGIDATPPSDFRANRRNTKKSAANKQSTARKG